MLRSNTAELSAAVVKTARILAGKDVRIIQKGQKACVTTENGKIVSITLPSVSENADPMLIRGIQGFIDHELGHYFDTDMAFTYQEQKRRTKEFGKGVWNNHHQYFNSVEDVRIEKTQCQRFAGVASNLNLMYDFFLEVWVEKRLKDMAEARVAFVKALSKGLTPDPEIVKLAMMKEENVVSICAIRALGGQERFADFCSTNETATKILEVIEPAREAIRNMKTTEDAFAVADQIRELLKDDRESAGGESSGTPGEGDRDEEMDGDEYAPISFDEALGEAISDVAKDTSFDAKYIAYSTTNDVIEPIKVRSKETALTFCHTQIEEPVNAFTHVLKAQLSRVIMAKSQRAWQGGMRRGVLNSSSLVRAHMGDDRAFKQRAEVDMKDTAATLLMDFSGSMSVGSPSRWLTAARAGFVFSHVLTALSVKNEVLGFTTVHGPGFVADEKLAKSYSRYEPLYMPIIKGFDQPFNTDVRAAFGAIKDVNFANNIDGECFNIASGRLMARREQKKIMFVLSDGNPSCHTERRGQLNWHLKQAVKRAMDAGVHVIGIGIATDDVKAFYPNSVCIYHIEDLPKVLLGQLQQMMA